MNVKTIVVGYLQENCYIVEKNNRCIIIDPGDEYLKIIEQIKYDVTAILITHNHFDHVGALEKIKNKYNVSVYNYSNVKNKKIKIADFNIEAIYTPGHTSDSVTYYFYDDQVMFTGDFVFKESIGRTDLDSGDMSEMKNSIEKIKKYDNEIIIYPGHGENTSIGYEKNNNVYFRR